MKTKSLRNYKQANTANFLEKAWHVHDCFEVIAPYPADVPPEPAFKSSLDNLDSAAGQSLTGSHADVAAVKILRKIVEAQMDLFADFADKDANGDPTVILHYGFDPSDPTHSKVMLVAPILKTVDNSASGQFKLGLKAVPGARGYEAEVKTATGDWVPAGYSTSTRNFVLPKLVPGTTYQIRVRAVAGNANRGPWSEIITKMCT
jgi:hypothetical protein